jgi:hypothetical protein
MDWADKVSANLDRKPADMHRVWRLNWHDSDHGHCQAWYVSEREAEAGMNNRLATDPDSSPWIAKEEIPVSRKLLVDWLNTRFNTDNG